MSLVFGAPPRHHVLIVSDGKLVRQLPHHLLVMFSAALHVLGLEGVLTVLLPSMWHRQVSQRAGLPCLLNNIQRFG
jgi:uncharacterized protein YjeT (DUF2065 family)